MLRHQPSNPSTQSCKEKKIPQPNQYEAYSVSVISVLAYPLSLRPRSSTIPRRILLGLGDSDGALHVERQDHSVLNSLKFQCYCSTILRNPCLSQFWCVCVAFFVFWPILPMAFRETEISFEIFPAISNPNYKSNFEFQMSFLIIDRKFQALPSDNF